MVRPFYGGPGPNYFSDSEESVWVDGQGWLHLKIRSSGGKWYCSEVYTTDFTQFGEHRFLIEGPMDLLDSQVVVGLFVYADDSHEIDIEFAKWGNPNHDTPGSYTIQPFSTPDHNEQFPLDNIDVLSTHFFDWKSDRVFFSSFNGHQQDGLPSLDRLIHRWVYYGDNIPQNGDHLRIHINFWLFLGQAPVDTTNLELIIHQVVLPPPLSTGMQTNPLENPSAPVLYQNCPNPFNDETVFPVFLTRPSFIRVSIFDISGRKMHTIGMEEQSVGMHRIRWQPGPELSSGLYLFRMETEGFLCPVQKVIYLK